MSTPITGWAGSEAELSRLLLENVCDYAVFALDPEGRVMSWSAPAERLLGYGEREVVGQAAERFYTPEDIADAVPATERRQALEAGRVEAERWYVRNDGSRFWSSGVTTPLFEANGALLGFAKIMRERTEVKRAEDARRAALAYAEGIVETVREPLVILDGRLRVKRANRAFYHTFQVSPQDTENRLLYDLGNGQWDIPRLRTLLEEILLHDKAFDDFEVEHDFPDIGRKVMWLNARLLRREGTDTELILLAIEDVTARRQAEDERRELETRFTALVKNVRDHAIFTLDPAGRITSWNVAAEHVLGYTETEVLGRHFALIFTPEDQEQGLPEAELRAAREQGRAEDERWHLRQGGERFWALGILSALHDAEGRLSGFSKVLRDMTAWKHAEQALRESEERLRVALSAADMGTWRYRIGADEQLLDESMRRLAGLPPTAAAQPLEAFLRAVDAEDRERVRAAFERCRRVGDELDTEFRVTWPDESVHWLKDRGKVVAAADGQALFLTGAAVDITDRRRLEERLREADRRKDAFLATLGHELRNPLAPIRNACAILELAGGSDPTVVAAHALIERQVSHLVRLIDDLLDVSRITRGKLRLQRERVGLAAVLERALEVTRPLIEAAGQQLRIALPPEPIVLEADPVRLAQVFVNLLNNACKYTPRGGEIRLRATQEGREAVVEVADTGLGIPAEHLPSIFEMFHQVPTQGERVQAGLGIGLALTQGLVAMHGGQVTAQSAGPGMGSTFRVQLPVVSARPVAAPAPTSARLQHFEGRVLVVDDQTDVAESLAVLLRLRGITVQTAADGLEALSVAERFRPELVLLDLGMPRLDGFETCRQLRTKPWGGALDIVAVTGWGQAGDRARSAAAGFDDHWIKPVEPGVVLERLASAHAHGRP